ncbi:hypothetical protein HYV80_06785 [Candidatus Woesearchaeota archaeon]|nr:hypothetical protein [Candidatus Woesearchaeota archaeon]
MKKLPQGKALEKRCKELGIECSGLEIRQRDSGENWKVYEFKLQKKIMEAERSIREHRLWIIALVSAIASAVSAIIALVAVLLK